jgi:hypothetical protein
MSHEQAGGFEYRGRGYRFRRACCIWEPGGELTVEAEGDGCWLRLVGVPFPGVPGLEELPGRAWEPDDEELSRHADTFAEGGLEVRGRHLWIMSGRIECLRFDADRGVLVLSFRLQVQEGESGREDETAGTLYGRVDS